uniref:Uncharacterized protein n=1 Tax=Plectus sambesii TaxID=2011161 RepID=A0A914V117_9BILA
MPIARAGHSRYQLMKDLWKINPKERPPFRYCKREIWKQLKKSCPQMAAHYENENMDYTRVVLSSKLSSFEVSNEASPWSKLQCAPRKVMIAPAELKSNSPAVFKRRDESVCLMHAHPIQSKSIPQGIGYRKIYLVACIAL